MSGPPQKALPSVGRGQNARLAARLTGWKIDIKPESAPEEEPEELALAEEADEEIVEETAGAEE